MEYKDKFFLGRWIFLFWQVIFFGRWIFFSWQVIIRECEKNPGRRLPGSVEAVPGSVEN
jgi:hypothetical protein